MKILITPQPKGRPRFTRTGIAYTPPATRDYEETLRERLREGFPEPLVGPVWLRLTFVFPLPKSALAKDKRKVAAGGFVRKATRPDLDNLGKAILDAANGIVYLDDAQVVRWSASKWYGASPWIGVDVEKVEEGL